MAEAAQQIGRVLRSSTRVFTVGCRQSEESEAMASASFGALVRTADQVAPSVYGLLYDLAIEDDAFVRQLVAAGVESSEIIEDQRQKRQVPLVAAVLTVGYGRGLDISHRLPPQPPRALDPIYLCGAAEVVRFTAQHDWLRTVLAAADVPAEQLLIAALRAAAAARPPDQRELYLVSAGRELARLLALDLGRLEGILRQLR